MPFRMRALVERTGISRSTIQHYLREGLLPKPIKLASNSALYGEEHVELLLAIGEARRLLGDRPPLAQLKRVVELIAQGVEPGVAVALQQAVWSSAPGLDSGDQEVSLTADELAASVGMERSVVESLVEARVLVPAPGTGPTRFDGMDLQIARVYLEGTRGIENHLSILARIASLLREVSELGMTFRNTAVAGHSPQTAAEISTRLQTMGTVWHAYLAFRFRQWDIAEYGLGPVEARP